MYLSDTFFFGLSSTRIFPSSSYYYFIYVETLAYY